MDVETFLHNADRTAVCCSPDDNVQRGAVLLITNKIGAMPVCSGSNELVGVLSERDIVEGYAGLGGDIVDTPIRDIMTANVVTCDTKMTMHQAMANMAKHHIRHLVVVDGLQPVAMISIRDALTSEQDEKILEANVLRDSAMAARLR